MLGKCLWKMHTADDATRGSARAPTAQEVLDAFVRAIDVLPDKRDSRREPILEPHYKLVSVIHKLVLRKELEVSLASLSRACEADNPMQIDAACEVLQASSYAKNVETPSDADGWEEYVLTLLKALRAADKSGWHHRMTARVGKPP